MATKQDIDKGVAVNMAGTVPSGHSLGPVRQRLLDTPRERQWVIGQVVSGGTNVKHPPEAADQVAPTMQFVDMAGIIDPAECDQLAAMLARAHAAQPGQGRLDLDEGDDDTPPPEGGRPLAAVPFGGNPDADE